MNRTVVAFGGNLPFQGQAPFHTFAQALAVLCGYGPDRLHGPHGLHGRPPGLHVGPHQLRGVARLWRSAPVAAQGPDFFNTAAWIDTPLPAEAWLSLLLETEAQFGRVRPDLEKKGRLHRPAGLSAARSLDLDLIWFAGQQSDSERLTLPHPRAAERGFVLGPLCDLPAALLQDLRLPCPQTGALKSVQTLWNDLPSEARQGLAAIDTMDGWHKAQPKETVVV